MNLDFRDLVRVAGILNRFKDVSVDLRAESRWLYGDSQVIRGGRVNRPAQLGLRQNVTGPVSRVP